MISKRKTHHINSTKRKHIPQHDSVKISFSKSLDVLAVFSWWYQGKLYSVILNLLWLIY